MNCKKVEELLPLYVGRELEKESARMVTTHVRACSDCARSAQEYSESNLLLQQFEPPQFSEATYAAVRSRVLREIEREARAPTLLQLLARPFQPRVRWAVSTAVLLAVCVFAYYFIANRTSGERYEQANAGHQGVDPTATAGGAPASATSSPKPTLNLPAQSGTTGTLNALASSPAKSRLNLKDQTALHSTRAGGSSTPAGLPGRGPRTPAVPVTSAQVFPVESKDAGLNSSVTSEKTLRLEIQTSDRNIRIIWFSHPSTNEGSPNESSKGI